MKKDTNEENGAFAVNAASAQLLENNCSMTLAMQVIGGKWKLLLLNAIRKECPMRFGELRKKMIDITHATLTAQLRELEADGVIERKVYAVSPPKVEYKLSALGKQLIPVMQALCDWGDAYRQRDSGLAARAEEGTAE
ncbi:winged helix-turn-helix transcriptional regulator [Chitinophaga rhizosphaerae]|uniref:winged helix-turn-helix transcriptional regulator n=1 Tax=Chitinophaga rhizosphaerae TaxID=1864947 RepID=UPI000F80A0A9|nr:helix-turn-helix domain-containing protein [Chitinophaga rhizosphaerae]